MSELVEMPNSLAERVIAGIPESIRTAPGSGDWWVMGGAVRDLALGESPRDIDIFTAHPPIRNPWPSSPVRNKNRSVYEWPQMSPPIQMVYVADPRAHLCGFDFTVCRAAVILGTGAGVCDSDWETHLAKRALHIHSDSQIDPAYTLARVLKFHRRGWDVSGDTLTRLITRLLMSSTFAKDFFLREQDISEEMAKLVVKAFPETTVQEEPQQRESLDWTASGGASPGTNASSGARYVASRLSSLIMSQLREGIQQRASENRRAELAQQAVTTGDTSAPVQYGTGYAYRFLGDNDLGRSEREPAPERSGAAPAVSSSGATGPTIHDIQGNRVRVGETGGSSLWAQTIPYTGTRYYWTRTTFTPEVQSGVVESRVLGGGNPERSG